MIRYFDVNAPEIGGGGVNVAELLAKQGVKTDDGISVEIPNVDIQGSGETEVKQEPEQPKAETAQPAPEPVQPQPDPIKPEPVQPAPVVEPPKPVETDWKDVLKKQPEVEVYKHLGLDDKMINFLSRWKGGEDLRDYLEAIATDYSKMSAEEIMRRYYLREFSGISAEDFQEIYKMKVTEHFKLDSDVFDEKDVRRGKLLLNYEADKIRQDFINKQQELLFNKPPEPPKPQAEIEEAALEAERQKAVTEYKGRIEGDAFTQELLTNKKMTIGEGEDAFNYEVSAPQAYLDILYDPAKWASSLNNTDGTPNVRKHILLAAIAHDDTTFFTNYAKHHQRIGAKKAIEPIENATPPVGTLANGDGLPTDPAAALAKAGVITSG